MIFDVEARAERREQLLFPKSEAKKMETAADLLRIQGFIDGRPGKPFRVDDIVNETNIPEATVYKILPYCERYRRVRKGVYLSEAEIPPPTEEGLEELQRMMRESSLGKGARGDWFWLIWSRNQARNWRSGAVIQKF